MNEAKCKNEMSKLCRISIDLFRFRHQSSAVCAFGACERHDDGTPDWRKRNMAVLINEVFFFSCWRLWVSCIIAGTHLVRCSCRWGDDAIALRLICEFVTGIGIQIYVFVIISTPHHSPLHSLCSERNLNAVSIAASEATILHAHRPKIFNLFHYSIRNII